MALTTPQTAPEGIDEELWAGICRVFFFHTKNTENSHEVLPDHTHDLPFEINEQDASQVVQIVEQITAATTMELPKLPETTEAWLQRLGFTATPAAVADRFLWSAVESSVIPRLEHIKDKERAQFHTDVAAVRYLALQKEIQRLQNASPGIKKQDLEGGAQITNTSYQETPQMASDQRDALIAFVRDHDEMLARPYLHGLYQVLTRQATCGAAERACYWDLDDAALVERGQDFAFDAVNLLLVHLRFHLVDTKDPSASSSSSSSSPTRVRRYMVDPQLSNRRIERLLQLLPKFPQKCPTSGTIGDLQSGVGEGGNWKRTNVDGAKDASCPQDSVLYPILSHCIIL